VTDDTSPAMARYARGAALRRMSKTALLKLCAMTEFGVPEAKAA
jgi:hypothetical protein